jgi:hypothetical protein
MPEQCSDPGRILDSGFPARNRLDVLGIHHQEDTLPFEEIVDRAPVHAGTFHCDMGTPRGVQPVG